MRNICKESDYFHNHERVREDIKVVRSKHLSVLLSDYTKSD